MSEDNIFNAIEKSIDQAAFADAEKRQFLENLNRLKTKKVNLLIAGATGSGKSSTINAMFEMNIAPVGTNVDPKTMTIEKYEKNNLVVWDSPGLGDGKEHDIRHSKAIVDKLYELDSEGLPLIDLVLVVLDAATRDLGTTYELINQVILPNLGEKAHERILIAINQSDMAMKGRHWNFESNSPLPPLVNFLDEKALSIKKRVAEATGIQVDPICYAAGYMEDESSAQRPWNLSKLLFYIVKNTKPEKRLAYMDNVSTKKEVWVDNDKLRDYIKETRRSFEEVASQVSKNTIAGATAGAAIGSVIPIFGTAVGTVAGAIVGFFAGIFWR